MRFFNSAREYHEKTKYAFDDVKNVYREYSSEPQPKTFKEYPDKPAINLPKDFKKDKDKFHNVVQKTRAAGKFRLLKSDPLSLDQLSQIHYLTNGVTRVREFPNQKLHLRAAPSASGLFPIEVYTIVNRVEGLDEGVYYFSPQEHRLIQLDDTNRIKSAVNAGFNLKVLKNAPVLLIFTMVFPRSMWKFKERAYRYCTMDAGYVGENLLLAAHSLNLSANLVGDFVDSEINSLLNLDASEEAAILMASVGKDGGELEEDQYQFGMHREENDRIDGNFGNLVEGIHVKSSHSHPSEDLTNVNVKFPFEKFPKKPQPERDMLKLPQPHTDFSQSTNEIIESRQSSHNFARIPLTGRELSTLLHYLNQVPVLYNYPAFHTYVVINDVEGISNGIYFFHPDDHQLELLKKGTYRGDISYLTLAQDAVFNCSVAFFFSTDFEQINLFSNRGYRYAHINIGMLSEMVYLTCTALGIQARGIGNFFDDSINSFFNVPGSHENILGGIIVGRS